MSNTLFQGENNFADTPLRPSGYGPTLSNEYIPFWNSKYFAIVPQSSFHCARITFEIRFCITQIA